MSRSWPLVPLWEILTKSDAWIDLKPDETYREVTVRLWGKGITQRREATGAEIAAAKRLVIHTNQFIMSRIDARNGAFGIVPNFLEGAIVSNDFPVFTPNPERILSPFLGWMSRTSGFVDLCRAASEGTTNRVRLKEDRFLAMTISLPPLSEQRRIVARIENLAAKIEEARGLRGHSRQELAALTVRAATHCFASVAKHTVRIGQAFRVTTGGTPYRSYPAYWGGSIPWVSSGEVAFCRIRDTREKITELGEAESNAKRYPSNTILIAMIGQGKTRGQCAILDCEAATNQNVAGIHVYETQHVPEYVYHWLVARYMESRSAKVGTAQPALSGQRVREMPIPLPLVEEQHHIVAYLHTLQAKVDSLKDLQTQTADELNAMLPSILDKTFKGDP